MPAVIQILERNGVGPVNTDKTASSIRFKNADDAVVDMNDRIARPLVGNVFSYEKVLLINCTTGPDNSMTDLRTYISGTVNFGTDITFYYGVRGPYVAPVNSDQTTGPFGHCQSLLSTLTPASPLVLEGGTFTPFPIPTYIGNHLYLQAKIGPAAAPGLSPADVLVFTYDET